MWCQYKKMTVHFLAIFLQASRVNVARRGSRGGSYHNQQQDPEPNPDEEAHLTLSEEVVSFIMYF